MFGIKIRLRIVHFKDCEQVRISCIKNIDATRHKTDGINFPNNKISKIKPFQVQYKVYGNLLSTLHLLHHHR